MRVLMLGWEFPPLMTGGLATATDGIVNGLLALGHEVFLVLPYFPFQVDRPGLSIISPEQPQLALDGCSEKNRDNSVAKKLTGIEPKKLLDAAVGYEKLGWRSHYETLTIGYNASEPLNDEQRLLIREQIRIRYASLQEAIARGEIPPPMFESMDERVYALSLLAVWTAECQQIDVVHAHDWMSFPALEMLRSQRINKPLIAHVHSTEFDRSGSNGNSNITETEKRGMNVADLVVCVSQYTRSVVVRNYGINPNRIEVAHNAASDSQSMPPMDAAPKSQPAREYPVVSFVGRVTYQKGPAYFVQAADLVLKTNPNVKFRVIGTGDLLPTMKQLVWELGIDKSFIFEGFVNPQEVRDALASSDIFVMPSVSEPFGIVALEAVQQNIPVIISKQSGVSEVLPNALRVDFWDTELLADRILSLLKYPRACSELTKHASSDLQRRTWTQTAKRLEEIYSRASGR